MNTISPAFLGLPMIVSLSVTGCPSPVPQCGDQNWDLVTAKDPCSKTGAGTGGGTGGNGGMGTGGSLTGGSGGAGGGQLIPGMAYVPLPSFPSASGTVLPPTRAFVGWKSPASIPVGRVFSAFDLCRTEGAVSGIDADDECPNEKSLQTNFDVIDVPLEDATTTWKVRARYANGDFSSWSPLQDFMTDHSLAARWRLDGDVKDSGKTASVGSLLNGAGFGQGVEGQALMCDGANDYADLGGGFDLAGPLTVSAWVFANGTPTNADSGILSKGGLNYALTYHNNGRIYFYIGQGSNNVNAAMAPGGWHHVAGTFDGTTAAQGLKLFVDGALVASGTSAKVSTGAMGALWMGRYSGSYFNGRIDNVSLYGRALSEAAVLNEFCVTHAVGGDLPLPAACQ